MADLIRVTFPGEDAICYKSPVNTVIEVLRKIGEERFGEITMSIRKRPLVSKEIYPELQKYTKEIIPGWYYINQSDTREKTSQLINISRLLNLNLTVEVGTRFTANADPKIPGATRPKNKLLVTMPDGEVIDYESYKDVFMACIDKLGPRRVSNRANIDLSANCSLLTVTNTTGNRRKIGDYLYLAIPFTAKEAKKILEIIGKRLDENIKVEVIPVVQRNNLL